jgi:hypothetical protein
MILNVVAREDDAFGVMRRLLTENHEDRRTQVRLARRALRLARSLVRSGVLRRLDAPDELGRRYVLTEALPPDFALNQPLAHFALAALDVLDHESPEHTVDVVSVVESVLEAPRQILLAQQHAARGEAIAEMKADGLDYEERMALLEEITWPRPLAELLEGLYETYRQSHPWLPEDALDPKSIVREMYEQGMTFTDLVSRYQLARSEGLVLRYLTDAYKTFLHTVPEAHRTPALEDLIEWLGETVRQTDSSLLDEWEALSDPAHVRTDVAHHEPPPPPRPISQQTRAFAVMVRNAVWRRVELVAHDDVRGLAALDRADAERFEPPRSPAMDAAAWDAAIEDYYADHEEVLLGADARGPSYLATRDEVVDGVRLRHVTQTLADPAGHHDWVIEADVDLDASDALGELAMTVTGMRRLGG